MSARLRWWLRKQWPIVLGITLFGVGLAYAVRVALRSTDGTLVYALDDAYIHMAIAKNLALHGVWGCTPFHFSSSTSSLLWTGLLGFADAVVGVREATPLVLNIIFAVLTLVVADHYLARWGAPAGLRAMALVGLVVACPLPGIVLMGMEHILHVLLTIWFAAAAIEVLAGSSERRSSRHAAGLAALGALLGSSRYEGLFLVAIVTAALFIRRQWTRGMTVGTVSALPTIAFGLVSIRNGWLFLPNSLMLKAGGEGASIADALLKPIGQMDVRFFADHDALFLLVLAGFAGALVHWLDRRSVWCPQVLAPLLLALMIVLHGHYTFTSMFWEYRYDAYLMTFGVFAAATLLIAYWPAAKSRAEWHQRLAPALSLATLLWLVTDISSSVLSSQQTVAVGQTYAGHVKAAQFLQRYYPNATIVVNDLGAATYFTSARILDMFGLGDIEPIRIRREKGDQYGKADIQRWTSPYRPTIALLQVGWGWVAPRIPDEWIRAVEVELPFAGERIGFFAIEPGAAADLRSHVRDFYGPLARQGYRIVPANSE